MLDWRLITLNYAKFINIKLRRKLSGIGIVLGLIGLRICSINLPEVEAPIHIVIRWASADMASTILVLSSLLGVQEKISATYLKVLDLIWISASAVGVVFAVVQIFANTTDEVRDTYQKNWMESRVRAIALITHAFVVECKSPTAESGTKCGALAQLNNALSAHGIIDDKLVNAACPQFPIDLSLPVPKGYTREQVEGCMASKYIAHVLKQPAVVDKQNVENWRRQTRYWPMILILFVALRLSKSIAEVFWK